MSIKRRIAQVSFVLSILLSTSLMRGQRIEITALDTNGPMVETLFPQDSLGNITITGTIQVPYSADTISSLVQDYLYMVGKLNESKVEDIYKGLSIVGCDITLEVGKRLISIPYAGTFIRPMSKISFSVLVEVRDGKMRYTLNNFYTKRWRISGEGKDQGPSNTIHWQRVNSIKKDAKGKERENMIAAEEAIYKMEYQAVMAIIEGFEHLTVMQEPL